MIGRMSFGQMKPLLSCSIAEEAIACGDALMSGSCEAVSVRDGKGHVSLCSGDVFPMKRKALPTVGVLRLLLRRRKLKRRSMR